MIVNINKELSGELIPLTSIDQLTKIDELSSVNKVVIFKHSTRCGISHAALEQVERFVNGGHDVHFYYLDLLANRSVSEAVSTKYGVAHHSPQVLVIDQEQAINHATHYAIDELWLHKATYSS